MASSYYTAPTLNVDGETADAADVNSVNTATLTAFELLEASLSSNVITTTLVAGAGITLSTVGANTTISIDGTDTSSITVVGTIATGVWQGTAIDGAYIDQTTITTVGTITTGVWNGTAITGTYIDESTVDHDSLLNYAAGEHFTQANITTVGTVTAGNVDAVVTRPVGGVLVERATDCTVAKFVDIIIPASMNGMELSTVIMTCTTAGVTGTMVGNIEKNGTDMLSTGVSIDTTETTSVTAATPYVIKTDGTEDVATGDVLTMEITGIHSGTAAKGCSMVLEFV